MDSIILKRLLPKVFAGRTDIVSDIWQHPQVVFERGKNYLIEANSGTGKSSLCSYVFGYRNDYNGEILFDTQNIATLSISDWVQIRKRHIALLWQELRLFPELTAMENVQIKNKLTGFRKKKQITAWFERLGIAEQQDSLVGKMSFGQQQRVALIRTLCQPFDFLLADEPISHLDEANSQIMSDILLEEARAQGAALICTSIGKHLDLPYDHTFRV